MIQNQSLSGEITHRRQISQNRIEPMLQVKSSSRVGRLSKNAQLAIIQQLGKEETFTDEMHRRNLIGKTRSLKQVIFKKERNLEDEVQQREAANYSTITVSELLKQLKKKSCKFNQFGKDIVQSLHEDKEISQIPPQQFTDHDQSDDQDGEGNGRVQFRADGEDQNKKETTRKNKVDEKQQDDLSSDYDSDAERENEEKKRRKEMFRGKNHSLLTVTRNQQGPVSASFRSITRDQRDSVLNKYKMSIPGVGKYYPKHNVTEIINPLVTISKVEYNRAENLTLTLPDLVQKPANSSIDDIKQNDDSFSICKRLSRKNSPIYQLKDSIQQSIKSHNQKQLSSLSALGDVQSINGTSQINKNLKIIQKAIDQVTCEQTQGQFIKDNESYSQNLQQILGKKRQYKNSITPQKLRTGWDGGHGQLDLNKQSQRRFVFENMVRVNDERFNYLDFPEIYSKKIKVPGIVGFGRLSKRTELFVTPKVLPSYSPSYNSIERKAPKYVNMNVALMKDLLHNID